MTTLSRKPIFSLPLALFSPIHIGRTALTTRLFKPEPAAMPAPTPFTSVVSIGDTDTNALPVREIAPALGFYTRVMGFEVVSRDEKRAVLRRGAAEIGLEVNDADPCQASCYFAVEDVEALRAEYEATGIEPTPFRIDERNGERYRVFFSKEPYGVCFCFGQKAE